MRSNLAGWSDTDLVRQVQESRDRDAFGELVCRHQAPLRAFLWRLTGSGVQAEDLAQDAFIRAYDNIAGFRGASGFRTWLFAIAYRESLRWRRRNLLQGKLLRILSEHGEASSGIEPEDALALQKALHTLAVAERAAILLCDACGFSHSEAAEALAIPLGTLKTQIQRAREKMREAMDGPADLSQGQLVSCRTS